MNSEFIVGPQKRVGVHNDSWQCPDNDDARVGVAKIGGQYE